MFRILGSMRIYLKVNPDRDHSFIQTAGAALTAGRASDGDWPHKLFVCVCALYTVHYEQLESSQAAQRQGQ